MRGKESMDLALDTHSLVWTAQAVVEKIVAMTVNPAIKALHRSVVW